MKKVVLALLIILLPSQLGYHFWPDWSLINGIRVDYLSPTLYLTDLIIVALMFITPPLPPLNLRGGRKGVIFIIFAVLNIFFSGNPLTSIYKWLRVYEYFWLFKYLIFEFDWKLKIVNWTLPLAILWTSGLALLQFLGQRSVGGWWYWLGERTFNITTPGIAKVFLGFGHWDLGFVLRPYATMSHPNALAGWLLVAGLIAGSWPMVLGLLTIPLTFSRSAILLLPTLLWRKSKVATIFLISTLFALFSNLGNPNSFYERQVLVSQSIQIIKQHLWLGVGLGNFVYWVPTIRQPVHNIYLLIAAEIGIPATVFIGFWLIRFLKNLLRLENGSTSSPSRAKSRDWNLRFAFLSILLTGMADHYWLTLPQNILLLVVVLAAVKIMSNEVKGKL